MTIARDALARSICARICDARRTHDELRVVDDVLAGLEHGAETIGPLDLERDRRDFDEEGAQECRDLLAYLAMQKVAAQHRRRERIARSLSASAAVSPACGGRAHPSRDESAGAAPAGSGARTPSGPLPRGNEPACSALPDAPAVVARESATFLTPIERGLSELANAQPRRSDGVLIEIDAIDNAFDDGGEG